jgi:hypothetical protein
MYLSRPITVVKSHMSRAMTDRYFHIRSEAKRAAVEGLSLAKPIFAIPKVTPLRKKS